MLIFRPGYGEYTATDSPAYVAIGAVPASGDVTLSPTGMASTSAFGAAVIAIGAITLAPSAVVNSQAFGAPTVTVGEVTLTATGIASTSAFGSPSATASYELDPTAVINSQAFGSPTVDVGAAPLNATSLVNVSAYGAASIVPGPVGLTATGIASANAYGAPTVVATYDLLPASVVGVQAFGNATIYNLDQFILPTGMASTNAFGSASIKRYFGFWELLAGHLVPRLDLAGEFDMWWERIAGQIVPRLTEADPSTPVIPTLVATDNRDGATATLTLTGSQAGTSNELFVSYWGQQGVQEWASVGTLLGDGQITINRPQALYACQAKSSLIGLGYSMALGNLFYVTDASNLTRNRIRDNVALSALKIAKRLGLQLTYQSAGDTPFSIWATADNSDLSMQMTGGETGTTHMVVHVPRQPDFPPEDGLVPGARVGVNGEWFAVDQARYGTESINLAPVFTLLLRRLDITVEVDGSDV